MLLHRNVFDETLDSQLEMLYVCNMGSDHLLENTKKYSIILYSLLDNAHDKFLKSLKVSLGENNNIVCR